MVKQRRKRNRRDQKKINLIKIQGFLKYIDLIKRHGFMVLCRYLFNKIYSKNLW